MPRVSQAYLAARRDEILAAAISCFARSGLHRATMQDIVRESGLSPGAIYNYFSSKDEIVEAIAGERRSRERAFIAEAQTLKDVAAVVTHIRRAFFDPLRDPRERRRRRVGIQLWAEAQRSPKIHRMVRRGIDGPLHLLTSLLARAQRRGEIARDFDAKALARMMVAVFQGFVLQLEWDRSVKVEPYVALLDLCVARLLRPARGRARRTRARPAKAPLVRRSSNAILER